MSEVLVALAMHSPMPKTKTPMSSHASALNTTHNPLSNRRIPDYPFRYDGGEAARPAVRTRRVARQAHRFYRELVGAYNRHGYNHKVHRVTKRQLKRAANALADLITSMG
jgi:hypothetical protein